jgi:dienelactone hydrolase
VWGESGKMRKPNSKICKEKEKGFKMTQAQVAPYGSWKSPISTDLMLAGSVRLSEIQIDGTDIYWSELRPAEKGRMLLVKYAADGNHLDITPTPFNTRTRVHEYGGGATMVHGGAVYFSNFADQRLYRQLATANATPEPLTPALDLRYADACLDQKRNRLICIREDHTDPNHEAVNTIVSINLAQSEPTAGEVLVAGNNFYASPRLSPDGAFLAWLTWNHPNMPWDGTELWVAPIQEGGSLGQAEWVAGGLTESIFQPEWSATGILHFISDRTGWWNLYRWQSGQIEALHPKAAEFGRPQWVFGLRTYAFVTPDQIVCCYEERGDSFLALLNSNTGTLEPLALPYSDINDIHVVGDEVLFAGASASEPFAIVRYSLSSRKLEVLRRSSTVKVDAGYLTVPRAIEFPTENGLTAHAFFYAPHNQDFSAPIGELPPLLVKSHGGPTSATDSAFNLGIQYWTSRGIAVLDVNYGGSTGYGRAYRQRLNGQWGIVDSDDCVNGAKYLVEQGEVDGERLAIDGGSAGGYTTLCVLTFRDTFKAGASYYGVSDLEALAKETHKFESRYLDSMIGPYPQEQALYQQRSPIHSTHKLNCALILLQGLEDKVVLPNQAETMYEAVRAKGLPVAYIPFEGEQHGFRQAANIKRAIEAELYFYAQVFGFSLAEPVEPVEIENFPPKK